ncbi:hypothetical protein AGLY_013758 [Aphis glycines]|uniref:Uncharacterized protein n=1 Tax=Aphis glycines TaxID=307491 RepID=A0A6G0T567_APHGL|nr:hypothetical protein AGLY_013758 [Aphis glycines]
MFEMDNLKQENKKLEDYISEIKNYNEMIEKIIQENDCLQMVYEKNVSTISSKFTKLKEEMFNSNQVPFDKLLPFDLDNDFLGFDSVSVTASKSVPIYEMQIDPQYESYGSLYHKIQNDSTDFHNTVTFLFDAMKQTNLTIETEIDYLKSVTNQTTETVEVIKKLLNRILRNDQDAKQELIKKRCILGRIKLDSSCHLAVLKLELKSLGNRQKIKIPTYTYNNYSSWYLKKLNVQRLFRIWSNMIIKTVNMSIDKTNN